MQVPAAPHRWNVSPAEAREIQARLASRVRRRGRKGAFHRIAGCDMAFSRDGRDCIAGVVVWDSRERRVVESRVARRRLSFPYVPGLLSFREAPAVLAALRKLRTVPDLVMCDGQGLAHPRRFGLACHIGVILDRPTLGCAKSRLVGRHREPGSARGARAPLLDGDEPIGVVLRTRDRVRPVYVSIGHRIDLEAAVEAVLTCAVRYRLPEPTREADRLVARVKRGMSAGG